MAAGHRPHGCSSTSRACVDDGNGNGTLGRLDPATGQSRHLRRRRAGRPAHARIGNDGVIGSPCKAQQDRPLRHQNQRAERSIRRRAGHNAARAG